MKAKASPPQAHFATTKLHENEHEDSTTKMSKPDELQDDAPKFDFTAIPLCGIDGAESTLTLFQDGAVMSTTTETLKDQAFEGVSEPPHRESVIVDRSCEATFNTNDLTSTSIVSSHLVLGHIYDDALILDDFVLPLDKTMATVEYDAPPHGSITMMILTTIRSYPPHQHHVSGMTKVT